MQRQRLRVGTTSSYARLVMQTEETLADVAHFHAAFPEGMALECGVHLNHMAVAYRTYGQLNAGRSNAILVCHALTGDQYVAERHPLTGRQGWWELVVGPGRPVDTNRFFVICANVLGGCMGSTGPRSPRHDDPSVPWGTDFPPVTIGDMVRAQRMLIHSLGISRLFAVMGGSMGGMQTLAWAAMFPDEVFAALPIATAAYHSAQNIAFHEVGRQAIFADPDWRGGRYWEAGCIPARGLAVARMAAHITYLSEQALTRKFGRRLRPAANGQAGNSLFGEMFEVESYLRHQGSTFVNRFDANSYLYITKAEDYFDLLGGTWQFAFEGADTRFLVISFTSDWLYPSYQSQEIVRVLRRRNLDVAYCDLQSNYGHDAFLVDVAEQTDVVRGFLSSTHKASKKEHPAVVARP